MNRFAGIAIACAAYVLGWAGCATAAPAALDVPLVTTAPPLDPHATLSLWAQAALFSLPWDLVHARPAAESTEVHVATDGSLFYVCFDARQREAITATQPATT